MESIPCREKSIFMSPYNTLEDSGNPACVHILCQGLKWGGGTSLPPKEEAHGTLQVSISQWGVASNSTENRADTLDPAEKEERGMKEELQGEVETVKTFVLLTLRASVYSEENRFMFEI